MSVSQSNIVIQGSDTFKIAQAIYHSVTGKTEKLARTFSENYIITESDIFQLHAKCEQMCTQWKVVAKNENITIQHTDDNKLNFTSIERLRLYDKSQTSPVEGITYEYNILIMLPDTEKPQPYKIVVRILSMVAMFNKMENNLPPPSFFRFFRSGAIVVEVEYVDYVIARTIVSTLDSWIKEVEVSKKSQMLQLSQRYSHWIPRMSGALMLLVSSAASFNVVDIILTDSQNDKLLAKFLIFTLAFVSASMFAGSWVGRLVESSIDNMHELSYIKLNRGDENLATNYKKKNRLSLIHTTIYSSIITIHAITCGIIASYIYEKWFK